MSLGRWFAELLEQSLRRYQNRTMQRTTMSPHLLLERSGTRIVSRRGLVNVPPKWKDQGWATLLETWLHLIMSYEQWSRSESNLEDVPWWYGERTLTGLLAAAAWKSPRSAWWSLEEFANERTGRRVPAHRGGKPLPKLGRGDLWLGLKIRSDLRRQHSFTIEAKQVSEGQNVPTVVKNIEVALGKAKVQLGTVRKDFRFGLPVAICYYWPAIPSSMQQKRKLPGLFYDAAENLAAKNRVIALRWGQYGVAARSDKWAYPGVLLVAEVYPKLRGWKRSSLEPYL
jgi:hypothetical protein